MYERIKEEALRTPEEIAEIEREADSDFMRASRRSLARSIEHAAPEPELPGEEAIRRLPEEPEDPW